MAKSLVIAEEHEAYRNRLQNYLEKYYKEAYCVVVFEEKKTFLEYIHQEKCEVVLFSKAFYDETMNLKNISLPVILLEEGEEKPVHHKLKWMIQKYTRISKLMAYINSAYEEVKRNKPLIYSFYSPAGGVGQTTIAIGAALSYLKAGRKVLYINLEEVDSTGLYFGRKSGGLSEHLSNSDIPETVQFLATFIKKDISTGILYWENEKAQEQSGYALQEIIDQIIDYEIANVVIFDLAHHYDLASSIYFDLADFIVLVRNNQIYSKYKMKQMLDQKPLKAEMKDKLRFVINQGKAGELDKDKAENTMIIEKLYAPNVLGLCEYIAENQLLKLDGMEGVSDAISRRDDY